MSHAGSWNMATKYPRHKLSFEIETLVDSLSLVWMSHNHEVKLVMKIIASSNAKKQHTIVKCYQLCKKQICGCFLDV
jgi:hypothetical protein